MGDVTPERHAVDCDSQPGGRGRGHCDCAVAEAERLRVELHAAKVAAKGYHDLDEANRAKVERLRKEAQAAAEMIVRLRDGNERLREALDWIYAEPEDPIKVQKRAREALDE